ncbi:hypothetical protein H1Q59_02430 [Holosporaceae bacterium 'Namur']|nr:hypothetical protein [Holosporaceae bacterium 'Namur']
MTATFYKDKNEYIVDSNSTLAAIKPVDFQNTGVIQHNLQWANGLYQFLSIKHGLALRAESLTSIFMSYVGYFSKYKGSIYGLTGTTGNSPHHEYLKEVHGVDLLTIPNFIYKDLTIFPAVICSNQQEWHQEISDIVNRKIAGQRAALIIMETIEEVEALARHLMLSGYDKSQIFIYGAGNEKNDEKIEKRYLELGDVIVATNLAGRGTDLKISNPVLKNGGLHVIMGKFPGSVRVGDQGFGRAARKDEPGSAQLVLNEEELFEGCKGDITCLYNYRAFKENLELDRDRLCEQPSRNLKDEIFSKYTDFIKEISTPTGYKTIKLKSPEEDNDMKKMTIYLFERDNKIYLAVADENKSIEKFDVTEMLADIDPKVDMHIRSILNKGGHSSSLNRQDYELIHFIIALKDYLIYRLFLSVLRKCLT